MEYRVSFALIAWLVSIFGWYYLASFLNSNNSSSCTFEYDRTESDDYRDSFSESASNDDSEKENEFVFNFCLIIFAMCIMYFFLASAFLFFKESLTSKDFGRFLIFGGIIILALFGTSTFYHFNYVVNYRYCGEDQFGHILFEIGLIAKFCLSAVAIYGIPAYIWLRIWRLHNSAVNHITELTNKNEGKPYVLLPDFKVKEDVNIVPVHLPSTSSKPRVLDVKELEILLDNDEVQNNNIENNQTVSK